MVRIIEGSWVVVMLSKTMDYLLMVWCLLVIGPFGWYLQPTPDAWPISFFGPSLNPGTPDQFKFFLIPPHSFVFSGTITHTHTLSL